jgi:hypothetical protein
MDTREERRRQQWDSLRHRHWEILRNQSYEPPKAPADEIFILLVQALFSPRHRMFLREVLMELLTDDIMDILSALSQERH